MTKRRTGSYNYKGFRKDVSDAPQPIGNVFIKRDGTKVLMLTVPPPPPRDEGGKK